MNIQLNNALSEQVGVFRDRRHAGVILAEMLENFRNSDALLLAIPSGGVPVAAEMAEQLGLELDIMPVSKILFPWTTESGFGAVAFDGTTWVNQEMVAYYNMDKQSVDTAINNATKKVHRRLALFRGERPFPQTENRTVILVDDGIAGGYTIRTGIEALRKAGSKKMAIAVPTASARSLYEIARLVDVVYCANIRSGPHFAVADAYENWSDVDEAEAISMFTKNINKPSAIK